MVKIGAFNYSLPELKRKIEFTRDAGRKFSIGDQKMSLNALMKNVLEHSKNASASELAEIRKTFTELKDSGYGEREKLHKSDFTTKAVAHVKHIYGSFRRDALFKKLDKLEEDHFKAINKLAYSPEKWLELGKCYEMGIGCKRDDFKAFQSYFKAGEKGQVPLAYLFLKAAQLAVENKDVKHTEFEDVALENFLKAAKRGDAEAAYMVGYCSENNIGRVANNYIHDPIICYEKAAELGNRDAQFRLGQIYDLKVGEENETLALKYYQQAADQGHAKAQIAVGDFYAKEDPQRAYNAYKAAADQDDPQGLTAFAHFLMINYKDTPLKNRTTPFKYLLRAANLGDSYGQVKLGDAYLFGIGCEKDSKEAFKLYNLAAKQNSSLGQFRLAVCYEMGLGCRANKKKADKIFNSLAAQGYQYAIDKLNASEKLE